MSAAVDHFKRNVEVLRAVVGSITYKPGWKFGLSDAGEFLIRRDRVPDAESPAKEIVLLRAEALSPLELEFLADNPARAAYRFATIIRDFEIHEMDEWLRFGGRRFREPKH